MFQVVIPNSCRRMTDCRLCLLLLCAPRGGRTETGLALKYLLRKGFPGGRNASVPQILIVVTDGRSQGHVAPPAKQLKERGVTVFAVGVRFPR